MTAEAARALLPQVQRDESAAAPEPKLPSPRREKNPPGAGSSLGAIEWTELFGIDQCLRDGSARPFRRCGRQHVATGAAQDDCAQAETFPQLREDLVERHVIAQLPDESFHDVEVVSRAPGFLRPVLSAFAEGGGNDAGDGQGEEGDHILALADRQPEVWLGQE